MQYEPLWINDLSREPELGQPVSGDVTVDLAIIGGGFVGLWTAIMVLDEDPSLSVAVLDKGPIGKGASSRNGGLLMSWWPKIGRLAAIAGEEDGRWIADQTTNNIGEMQDFLTREQIDAEVKIGGWLWTYTCSGQAEAWSSILRKTRELGRPDVFRELPAEEVARRTGSSAHLGGIYEALNGQVHPGRLAYGLATVAARRGAKLMPASGVDKITQGSPVQLHVGTNTVSARKVVVASNIAADSVPELRRRMVLVTSAAVATAKIPKRLKEIGWTGNETITDSQSRLNYYRTTQDGRIVYGMGVARLSYGNRMRDNVNRDEGGIGETERNFRRVYPMLSDVPIEYGWSGPIDRTYDGLPLIGRLPGSANIFYGVGWSGNGVGPSRLGAKILAALVLGKENRWTQNVFVNREAKKFPPEPVRYVMGTIVRDAVVRKDRAEIAGKRGSIFDRVLASFAPAGTEDKSG